MLFHRVSAIFGSALVTAMASWSSDLSMAALYDEPFAVLLMLALLFSFAYAAFKLSGGALSRIPIGWPAPMRWCIVLLAALVLASLLLFYQLLPAFLLAGWCKSGFSCGIGNSTFNLLLSAGEGPLYVLLVPVVTVSILLVSYREQFRV